MNVVTGYPQCSFEGYRVELDKESEVCLLDLVSAEGFAVKGGKLACQLGAGFQGAYVWVHTRKVESATLVSTQVLIVKNDLYEEYTSAAAYQRAVKSYGGENDAFLTPSGTSVAGSAEGNGSTGGNGGGSDTGGSDNGGGSDTGSGDNTGGGSSDGGGGME